MGLDAGVPRALLTDDDKEKFDYELIGLPCMPLLTDGELRELMGKIGDTGPCPECGPSTWGAQHVAALPLLEQGLPEGVDFASGGIPVLPLTCEGCGMVRIYQVKEELRDMGKL